MSTNPLVESYETYIIIATFYGLHVYFNFGKILFINDGSITKKNFGTKNVFLAPNEKTKDRIHK